MMHGQRTLGLSMVGCKHRVARADHSIVGVTSPALLGVPFGQAVSNEQNQSDCFQCSSGKLGVRNVVALDNGRAQCAAYAKADVQDRCIEGNPR